MVKVKPCPHIHAGGALVHQAGQAHRSARSRGLGGFLGPVTLTWLGQAGQDGRRAAERRQPPRLAGLVSVSTTCRNPRKSAILGLMVTQALPMARWSPSGRCYHFWGVRTAYIYLPPMVITGTT